MLVWLLSDACQGIKAPPLFIIKPLLILNKDCFFLFFFKVVVCIGETWSSSFLMDCRKTWYKWCFPLYFTFFLRCSKPGFSGCCNAWRSALWLIFWRSPSCSIITSLDNVDVSEALKRLPLIAAKNYFTPLAEPLMFNIVTQKKSVTQFNHH